MPEAVGVTNDASLRDGWEGGFSETSGALVGCLLFPANQRHLLCVAVVKHVVEHVSALHVWSRSVCESWSAFAFLLYYVVLPVTTQMSGQLLVVGDFFVWFVLE